MNVSNFLFTINSSPARGEKVPASQTWNFKGNFGFSIKLINPDVSEHGFSLNENKKSILFCFSSAVGRKTGPGEIQLSPLRRSTFICKNEENFANIFLADFSQAFADTDGMTVRNLDACFSDV